MCLAAAWTWSAGKDRLPVGEGRLQGELRLPGRRAGCQFRGQRLDDPRIALDQASEFGLNRGQTRRRRFAGHESAPPDARPNAG